MQNYSLKQAGASGQIIRIALRAQVGSIHALDSSGKGCSRQVQALHEYSQSSAVYALKNIVNCILKKSQGIQIGIVTANFPVLA
jgi:hypothetical protein